jgi:hypothetical protein
MPDAIWLTDDHDTIATVDEVREAPLGTVAVDNDGYPITKVSADEWAYFDGAGWGYVCNDEVTGELQGKADAFLPLTKVRFP